MAKRPYEVSPSKLLTWDVRPETPEKQIKIPIAVTRASPSKKLDTPRTKLSNSIQTLVFFDLETTGLIKKDWERNIGELSRLTISSESYTNKLNELLLTTGRNDYPRITEMSFISCPRKTFEAHIETLKQQNDENGDLSSSYIPTNTHTRQIDPVMTHSEWIEYEVNRQKLKNKGEDVLVHSQNFLTEKNSFEKEWPAVCDFLNSCKKPIALIAHNALKFDLRVLYSELKRFNMLESHPVPDQVYFADSYIGIVNIEENYHEDIKKILNGIDFASVSKILKEIEESKKEQNEPASEIRTTNELSLDHPYRLMKTQQWSIAKRRRFPPNIFSQIDDNWKCHFAREEGKYSLGRLFKECVKREFTPHYAQQDTEALMHITLAYGEQFLEYIDKNSAVIPF